MQLRANLTKLVQFVIHPSATPSMDLINYALVAGGQPKTQAERDAYLSMMKKIAREIPELVKQFTTTETLPNGQKVEKLDNSGLDARITMRAIQYVQKQREEKAKAAEAAKAAAAANSVTSATASNSNAGAVNTGVISTSADSHAAVNIDSLSMAGVPTETPIVSGFSTNNQMINSQGTPAVQDLQHNTIIPAADGTISLEDIFMHINYQNTLNAGNQQQMFI